MTLTEILELMHRVAGLTNTHICLGIQVRPDGTGRTTSGTLDDGLKLAICEFGPSRVEWGSSREGGFSLAAALQTKLTGERKAHSQQTGIFCDE